jgi:hypothetical protein
MLERRLGDYIGGKILAMEDVLEAYCLGNAVLTYNFKGHRAHALGESGAGGAMYVVEAGGVILHEFGAVIEDMSVGRSIVAKALSIVVVSDSLLENYL